jgi:hypothetical protein
MLTNKPLSKPMTRCENCTMQKLNGRKQMTNICERKKIMNSDRECFTLYSRQRASDGFRAGDAQFTKLALHLPADRGVDVLQFVGATD